jgi:amidohydrolase
MATVGPYIKERRRWFHAHPELSGQEHATTAAIARELDALGITWEQPLETGLIGTLKGGHPHAYREDGTPRYRVLLRADIDALPVSEETGLTFSSCNAGVSHACGHDCHIAMTLGALKLLTAVRRELAGEVRVVFQPAEETSSGARQMVAAGVCDGVDVVYGAHVWSDLTAGTVSIEPGSRMANTDWWRIDVTGKAAHAAMPHTGSDAILAASAIVEELQTIVSRNVSPFEPCVITVGQIEGGTAKNVMAGSAWLAGTVRTFDAATHERMPHLMERVARETARALGCEAHVTEYSRGSKAVINAAGPTAAAARSAARVLGKDALVHYAGCMPGEDFSEYLEQVPGVFAFIGATDKNAEVAWPQHSSHYNPHEEALRTGALVAAQFAYDLLT